MEWIRVFVGKNDSQELSLMANKALEEGAVVGGIDSEIYPSLYPQLINSQTVGVEVSGGLISSCVARVVKRVLRRGFSVRVNIQEIRLDHQDIGNQPGKNTLLERRTELVESLGYHLRKRTNLFIEGDEN